MTDHTPGERAFNAYRHIVGNLTHDGRPIPQWNDLTETIRNAWEAAATSSTKAAERTVQGWMALDLHTALGLPVNHTADHQGYDTWADWWAHLCAAVRTNTTHTALGDILLHLDRCAHGRHAGDECGTAMYNSTSCPGTSTGNPHMPPGTVIGYHLRGRIVVPPHADRHNPDAWLRRETYDPRREPGSTIAPLVKGKCPACAGHTLFLARGGHITCMRSTCPNPTQLNDQINKDTE